MIPIYLLINILFFSPMSLSLPKNHLPAYQLFDKQGKAISYEFMLEQLSTADVILFGELHNNPICHWLQIKMAKQLYAQHQNKLVLAAEMFEADDQLIIDEYLAGKIKEQHLEAEAKIWNNYSTDYKPLLLYAKDKEIPFVASNVPRRYASLVSREGLGVLEELDKEAKKFIAPLPIATDLELPGYKNMLNMMGSHGGNNNKAANFAYAQAIKDATMAHFIIKNLEKDSHLLHFNGAYHSNNFEGINWYLKQQKPKIKILTISSIEQEHTDNLEEKHYGLADFVIAISADMTKTY